MLTKDEIHRIWSPPQAVWTRWVKPVLFAFMDGRFDVHPAQAIGFELAWVPAPETTAIIVDLASERGVTWGIELARLGYRPIPIYNGLPFPVNEKMSAPETRSTSTVEVEPILAALYREAETLEQLQLSPDAPPAFLLDADRGRARVRPSPGIFDNRSVCFETDFPSAAFLLSHSIRQAIVVQKNSKIARDLTPTLLSWQRAGIEILRKKVDDQARPSRVSVERPSILWRLWYHFVVAFRLRAGELGGFGGVVSSAGG